MSTLIAACACFLGIHVVISGSPLRSAIVARIGERLYLLLFSLLSLAGMIWLARAYGVANRPWLWSAPRAVRWAAPPTMLIAIVFVVAGLTTPSPTATGGGGRLDRSDAAYGMVRITRHPFLWGVALWAALHLVLNGDAASVVLFGSLLLLALLGPHLIDAKRRRAFGAKWDRFAAVTSNVPFAAIASGRNHLRPAEIGLWRLLAAVGVWALLLAIHPWLFGVPALPG
jgi:uncharacterized membrane protein